MGIMHYLSAVQVGFFSIVGIPLIKAMTDVFEDAKPMLDGVLANFHSWEAASAVADTATAQTGQ